MYFPKQNNWFDFYTGEKYSGGQFVTVNTNEHYIPTFVRGGAIIPFAKPMQSTKEYNGNEFILHYYYDASVSKSKGKLYNDDGLTNNAEKSGLSEEMEFEAKLEKNRIDFELESDLGDVFKPSEKNIEMVVHHLSKEPRSVRSGWKRIKHTHKNGTLKFPVQWNTAKEKRIRIKL